MKDQNKSSGNGKDRSFDPNANKEVKELTHKALVSFLRDQLKNKQESKKDLDVLTSQVLEFLNSFILVGYNFEGEPITIVSAHNQQEADSLGTLINKFIFNQNSSGDQ
jgi:hypothetical protein